MRAQRVARTYACITNQYNHIISLWDDLPKGANPSDLASSGRAIDRNTKLPKLPLTHAAHLQLWGLKLPLYDVRKGDIGDICAGCPPLWALLSISNSVLHRSTARAPHFALASVNCEYLRID